MPTYACNSPCANCSTSNASNCYNCFSDLGFPYLHYNMVGTTSYGTCLTKCPAGYTTNGDTTNRLCVPCDSSCGTCVDNGAVGDRYKCLTCSSGYNFRSTVDMKCLTNCSNGYY